MKKYILSILLSGAFMFTACSDFLDEVPKGNITSEGYYKTAPIERLSLEKRLTSGSYPE